jgi:hypothetical protein
MSSGASRSTPSSEEIEANSELLPEMASEASKISEVLPEMASKLAGVSGTAKQRRGTSGSSILAGAPTTTRRQ